MSLRLKMPRSAPLCAMLGAVVLAGCAPVTQVQGFQVIDERPDAVKIGEDTAQTVRTKLGTPTAISTFEPNVWYYVTQVNDTFGFYKPKVRQRQIVAITFDKESQKVAAVNQLSEKDGRQIAYNDRETPTRGRQMSIWEQILGSIGTPALPREDDDPGAPGQGR